MMTIDAMRQHVEQLLAGMAARVRPALKFIKNAQGVGISNRRHADCHAFFRRQQHGQHGRRCILGHATEGFTSAHVRSLLGLIVRSIVPTMLIVDAHHHTHSLTPQNDHL